MAQMAKRDMRERTIQVKRTDLVSQLLDNRNSHEQKYLAALSGYKEQLRERTVKAFEKARASLELREQKMLEQVDALQEADIHKQRDTITVVEAIVVDMPVPRSYLEEYDAAIAMFNWDTRDELELTYAEFNCFVRDNWDWSSDFSALALRYA